jgi:hypothetical protein
MGKLKSGKGGGGAAERHIRLHFWVMNTDAWKALSPDSRAALLELYRLFNGSNNGALFMSCRTLGRAINCDRMTANRALWALESHGFIRAKDRSGYDYKAVEADRRATTWVLTEFPHGTALPTKEFARWKAGDDFRANVPKRKTRSLPSDSLSLQGDGASLPSDSGPENRPVCHSPVTVADEKPGKASLPSDSTSYQASAPRRAILAEAA